jgi:tRNA (mo5U34)-methyltransferase
LRRVPHSITTPLDPAANDDVRLAIEQLGPWFHNLNLRGIETAPEHFLGDYPREFFGRFAAAIPSDLSGWSVLDVGCNGGFYSFEMKRRGAARVVGIDHDPLYLEQARFAARLLDLDVEFRHSDVYDIASLGETFDLVLFLGVLYHLRHPLLALDLLRRSVVGRLMVFQSMTRGSADVAATRSDYGFSERSHFDEPGYPKLHFVEQRYVGDATNWWIPNRACAEAMLRSAGFAIAAHPDSEVWVCTLDPDGRPEIPRAFEVRP